jgi:L-alanine-DL-glutamate epimerase-like enolase superfamily enzyme
MRIARIDVFQVDLPYSGGRYLRSGGREYRSFEATLVRITTDGGLEGWDESTPFAERGLGVTPRLDVLGDPVAFHA